jgi:hypothetical protein
VPDLKYFIGLQRFERGLWHGQNINGFAKSIKDLKNISTLFEAICNGRNVAFPKVMLWHINGECNLTIECVFHFGFLSGTNVTKRGGWPTSTAQIVRT